MKKLLMLIFLALVPMGMMAQGWLNRAANDYRQRNQQQTIQRNRNQQLYQNRQRYNQQERANQQRREMLQREYMQQQRRTLNSDSSTSLSSTPSETNSSVQNNNKVVTLVVNGTGNTKEEATKNALRSAIDQAFGTFVSANTEVLNDELVKDEIVTVSTGNIQKYEELSNVRTDDGFFNVSLNVIVSINKLVDYAQSKGMKTELAGQLFVNNIEIKEQNKINESKALFNLRTQLMEVCKKGLFDYTVQVSDPIYASKDSYQVQINVRAVVNNNTIQFCNLLYNTLLNLTLSSDERKEYTKMNLRICNIHDDLLSCIQKVYNCGSFVLRDDYYYHYKIQDLFVLSLFGFETIDNLGNSEKGSGFRHSSIFPLNTDLKVGSPICFFQKNKQYTREQLKLLKDIIVNPIFDIPDSYYTLAGIEKNKKLEFVTINETFGVEVIDQEAEFVNGQNALLYHLSKAKYPAVAAENGVEGDVIVQFDVKEDGNIVDLKIAKSIDSFLDKEALRVVGAIAKPSLWRPAIKNGKPIRSRKTVTVPFRLGH